MLEQFRADGFQFMFGNPGTVEQGFLDALGEYPDLKYILTLQESVAVMTADGTRAIAKEYLDVGKMFGARTRDVWLGIALPSALPHIAAGIDLGIARGITNAIAVEVLASVPGMGMSVFTKSAELNENASLVYVLALAVFAVGVRALMARVRGRLAPWYRK